ncbi:MAG: hypothetical protein IT537_08295 [Hyphomicrobiales bacterium]|nr:hypothetical protein [Hyphomicrobiales bacterium]
MSEHREAFIHNLRVSPEMRTRMLTMIEQRHAQDFVDGRRGVRLYEDLLDAVREVPGAVAEFEQRFFPLLDPDGERARRAAEEAAAKARAEEEARERAARAEEAPPRRKGGLLLPILAGAALGAAVAAVLWRDLLLPQPPAPPAVAVPAVPTPTAPTIAAPEHEPATEPVREGTPAADPAPEQPVPEQAAPDDAPPREDMPRASTSE